MRLRPARLETPQHHAAQAPRRRAFAAALMCASVIVSLGLAPLALAFDLPPSQPGVSVYDFADIWSGDTIASAQQTADRLRGQTGVQMAIVSIPTGESDVSAAEAQQTAKDAMDAWGVGQAGANNGIVVLFDMNDTLAHGQITIYAGAGITGTYLSVGAARNIVADMLIDAQNGDLDSALARGMGEIAAAVDNPGSRLEAEAPFPWPAYVALAVDAAFLLLMAGLWVAVGRDPAIPSIDDSVLLPAPPPGLTPSMAALLREGTVSRNALAGAFVDLASRNLLSMRDADGSGGKLDYVLADPADPGVAAAEKGIDDPERLILATLRRIATDRVVRHADMAKAPGLVTAFGKALGRVAAASDWFRSDPTRAINRFGALLFIPIAAWVVPFVIWLVQNGDTLDTPTVLVTLVPSMVVFFVGALINFRMASRSRAGSSVLAMALAYRNTISHEIGEAPGVVAAQRKAKLKMPWLETPDALIVWAVALGLAKEVGQLVTESGDDAASAGWHPAWYAGSAAAFGSFASFGSSLTSITATSGAGGGYGGGVSVGGGGASGGF